MDENSTPPAGETPPDPAPTSGPRVSSADIRDVARLRRSSADRHVAGVAGGLARHLDIDPILVRVGFVIFTLFGGAGLLLYGALWLLVPEDDDPKATIDLDDRSRSIAVLAVGALAGLAFLGNVFGGFGGDHDGFLFFPVIPVVIVAYVAWLVIRRRERRRQEWLANDGSAWAATQDAPAAATIPVPGRGASRRAERAAFNADVKAHPEKYRDINAWRYTGDAHSGYRWVRDPRKKGPLLFWIALPLIALSLGVLGMVDLGGTHVIGAAYPALALAIVAGLLLLGSFWGRAGGLILLGLLLVPVTAVATVADTWEGDDVTFRPTSVSQLPTSDDGTFHLYHLDAGRLVVDLTGITDLDSLDGQTVRAEAEVGEVVVIVPRGIAVDATADTAGPGGYEVFGTDGGGIDTELTVHQQAPDAADDDDAPRLTVLGHVNVGHIEIRSK